MVLDGLPAGVLERYLEKIAENLIKIEAEDDSR